MQLKYTKKLFNKLEKVNAEINSYRYFTEGVMDLINLEDLRVVKEGVCSDYAYTKMLVLKEQGVDDSAMAISICVVNRGSQTGGRHAVLIVSTDKGDFILDNRFPMVIGFEEASNEYIWEYIPDYIKGDN